ncbi:MAG: PqiC family protein [Gemmatimonadota bacterium]
MQTRTTAIRFILLSSLFALAGCFSLSRDAPAQKYYVLGAGGDAAGADASPAMAEAVIGLRLPRMAGYLTTPFIVVRTGQNEIDFSQFDRWGEGLGSGVNRAVARHMAAQAPHLRVEIAPWPGGVRPDYLIQIQLDRFEGVAPEDPSATEGEAHLHASWEILRRQGDEWIASGTTEVREPGWTVGDFDDLVTLLEAGLVTLAHELVAAVESESSP